MILTNIINLVQLLIFVNLENVSDQKNIYIYYYLSKHYTDWNIIKEKLKLISLEFLNMVPEFLQ